MNFSNMAPSMPVGVTPAPLNPNINTYQYPSHAFCSPPVPIPTSGPGGSNIFYVEVVRDANGLGITYRDNTIVSLIPGSPASQSGVEVGDRVVMVSGVQVGVRSLGEMLQSMPPMPSYVFGIQRPPPWVHRHSSFDGFPLHSAMPGIPGPSGLHPGLPTMPPAGQMAGQMSFAPQFVPGLCPPPPALCPTGPVLDPVLSEAASEMQLILANHNSLSISPPASVNGMAIRSPEVPNGTLLHSQMTPMAWDSTRQMLTGMALPTAPAQDMISLQHQMQQQSILASLESAPAPNSANQLQMQAMMLQKEAFLQQQHNAAQLASSQQHNLGQIPTSNISHSNHMTPIHQMRHPAAPIQSAPPPHPVQHQKPPVQLDNTMPRHPLELVKDEDMSVSASSLGKGGAGGSPLAAPPGPPAPSLPQRADTHYPLNSVGAFYGGCSGPSSPPLDSAPGGMDNTTLLATVALQRMEDETSQKGRAESNSMPPPPHRLPRHPLLAPQMCKTRGDGSSVFQSQQRCNMPSQRQEVMQET